MRRSLILAAALALAGAPHANAADNISHAVNMTADVETLCSFTALSGDDLTIVNDASSNLLVQIDPLSKAVEKLASLTFDTAQCNSTTTIALTRNGFRHVAHGSHGPLPMGVGNQIDYAARVNWGGPVLLELLPGTDQGTNPNVVPHNNPLTLSIHVLAGEVTLVAGNYQDTLTLTVNPN